MNSHSEYPAVLPESIWQASESGNIRPGEEFLSEHHVIKRCGVDVFLGLITGTGERTVHLRVPEKHVFNFPFSSPAGLWVKPFIFTDHTMLAVVLTDDELQPQFSRFATEFITQLSQAKDAASILNLLTAQLAGWQPVPDQLRCVA